ncbi:MAG: hypothetical protein COZ79_09245 [Hydrogenophilales bacterium CG_4_8_14_3_um_filter_62_83]|nr:MAG: hypothetical protein COZ79_09245 [Hydrogenophilales bacterium CG_4_8_14_3_um_filter_62_83]PIY99071.1 MAG: hypothetical protein COY64_02785 [Hydrogenophilales bacterium CG_4_10_14_0_8_um_filter_62_70]
MFKEQQVAKKSLKNSKHLVDLIESATLRAISVLAQVDQFMFLGVLDASKPEDIARAALIDTLASVRREAIAIADDEAVRILQLARFRTEEMLEHAYAAIEFDAHAELDSFDRTADAMTRLVWLRAKAPKVFDQIETIYLTHHFHGHKKFLGFTVRDGDGRDFVWTEEVATKLHEGVGEILGLDDEAKASCEVIHFEMDDGDGDAKRRLHYLVVYHPGKMRTLRQMKDRRRDLLLYIPALEATLVYDPADNKVHVLSDRQSTAKRLADRFSLIGFDKPLSKQPVDAVSYELTMFKNRVDLKAAKATGALIQDAWISSLTVTLGHTQHSVTVALASSDNIWGVSSLHFGDHNPLTSCRSVQEIKLSFVIRFDGDSESRALDITVGQRGSCNLLTLPDPRLRRCGEDILTSLGVMKRVQPAKVGASLALFRAEMKLLDLTVDEVDGHLLSALELSTADLVSKGLLKKKTLGDYITIPIEDDDGQSGFRRLEVQFDSTSTWAHDDLSGERYDLTEGDMCRYSVDKSYLRERLDQLLKHQLTDKSVTADEQEPFVLGYYRMGDQLLPVALVSRLWEPKHADKMDTELRQANLGLTVVLTTTIGAHRRFLGPGIVISLEALVQEVGGEVSLDLSRVEGEVRRRQATATVTDIPCLIQEDSRNALLVGPWPEPWALTKKEWVDVVEVLVSAWTSHKRKCTKLQLEDAAGGTIRSMNELFRGASEWRNYIRGADGNDKPRLWELNIGVPDYQPVASDANASTEESVVA